MEEWPETISALNRLETLLHCPLCHCTMNDPCSLENCDHHFCKSCILVALSGRNSACPKCSLPAWVRDVRSNRQLETLIKLVYSMKTLVQDSDTHRPSIELQPSTPDMCNTIDTDPFLRVPTLSPHDGSTTSTHMSGLVAEGSSSSSCLNQTECNAMLERHPRLTKTTTSPLKRSDRNDGMFRKPHIREQLIQRHLKATAAVNLSRILSETATTSNKATNTRQSQRPPLGTVNHRRAHTLPSTSSLLHLNDLSRSAKVPPATESLQSEQENPSVPTTDSFAKPRTRRRRSTPLKVTTAKIPDYTMEFPFSPLVTKTRNYARLDSAAKVQRLNLSTQSNLPMKRPLSSPQGAPKHKRVHQLKVDELLDRHSSSVQSMTTTSRSDTQGKALLPPSPSTTLHGESPVPPTPSSAHASTMRRNIRGETPLHIAAIKGDVSAVRSLLQQGADPNTKDHAGWTPLHEACNHGHIDVVSLLLDHGALINIPGFENDTPLHDAVCNGRLEVASLLVARGANLSLRNRQGLTPLDLAVTDAMRGVLVQTVPSPGLHVSPNTFKSPHASPVLNGGPSRVVLLATGLKGYQKTQMEEVADLLGAQVVSSFSTEVTHVVTGCDKNRCCPRTLKFLCAVALGRWIVSFQWISRCLQERCWVDETPHEVLGVTVGDSVLMTESPRKGRENAIQKAPGLFDGCEFYLSGNYQPPQASKEDLGQLIKLAGGQMLSREPKVDDKRSSMNFDPKYPYHAKPESIFSKSHSFIVHSLLSSAKTSSVATVPASWILDCLSHFELLDVPE